MGLENLKQRFNPRRTYKNLLQGFSIEVDGVFVRVDETLAEQKGREALEIPIEDFLQDPATIRSARVSTGRDTKIVDEKAAGLIGGLYKGRHETPFEGGVMFRFRVTVPICFAQAFFQLPYSHNEISGRYTEFEDHFYAPRYEDERINALFKEAHDDCWAVYKQLLALGVAKEQARFALPFRFYTVFYWTISLRHVLEILSLEQAAYVHAGFWQGLCEALTDIIRDWTPWAHEKAVEHRRVVSTGWYCETAHEVEERIERLQQNAFRYAEVGNIGKLWLISIYGSDELLKLGIHTRPNPRRGLGHGAMTMLIECPIFVHRQWVRHRYGVWSELPVAFDRIVAEKNFYIPQTFRKQLGKAMEYRYEDMVGEENDRVRTALMNLIERSIVRYWSARRILLGEEGAALNLPYIFRIRTLLTMNVESLINFFSLRCDEHAQWETRQFANIIYGWFRESFPWANKIFLKHLNFGKSPFFKGR